MGFYKKLGDRLEQWLKEKIKVVDTKVESIAKYQKYVNTELDYCHLILSTQKITVSEGSVVPFNTLVHGNMEVNTNNSSVLLKANKTYKISADIYTFLIGSVMFNICDITNNKVLSSFTKSSSLYNGTNSNTSGQCIYTPQNDCEIQVNIKALKDAQAMSAFEKDNYFIIEEINRQTIIDPVEHVNKTQGIEDTPVGHIIAHMGTVAPPHYLICDGAEYKVSDYPYLAQHIEDSFGSIGYFGGDGISTFRVPDLRGEFLRGTGTATRNTGTGTSVGKHQDGTISPMIGGKEAAILWLPTDDTTQAWPQNVDKYLKEEGNTGKGKYITKEGTWDGNSITHYTSRPTNTAVLYCIKYEPTYFMNTYNTNYMQPSMYSEEERIVGCWIDGKPLYEKTIKFLVNGNTVYSHNIQNVDYIFIKNFVLTESSRMFYTQNSIDAYVTTNQVALNVNSWNVSDEYAYTVLQYTKVTDEENSFTNDMLKDSYVELTYSNEEIADMVADILGGEE